MKTIRFSLVVLLVFFPHFLFSQERVTKGTATEQEKSGTSGTFVIKSKPSVYPSYQRNCYVLTVGVDGPFNDQETFPNLSFPAQDCESLLSSVNSILRYGYRIHTFSLKDVDPNLRLYRRGYELLEEFKNQPVRSGDLAILYFSGHGITKNGSYYFPMIDADVSIESGMIRGDKIMEVAATLANKGARVLLFLDTCQSGGILLKRDVNISGSGGIACFPAASYNASIQEWIELSSSPFGDKVKRIFSGEEFRDSGVNDLTVAAISDRLKEAMVHVEPRFYSSGNVSVGDFVITDNLQGIMRYNSLLKQYKTYLESAENAMSRRAYHDAMNHFSKAEAFKDLGLEKRDLKDLGPSFRKLNQAIADACAKEAASSNVWVSLGALDDRDTVHLDRTVVPLDKLYLGCGDHYREIDPNVAFGFYQKAYQYGNEKEAPLALYELTENRGLPYGDPISEEQRQRYLSIAKEHGALPDPVPVVSVGTSRRRSLWDIATEDGLFIGGGVVSDFAMYPIGFQADVFYGFFHFGLGFAFGNAIDNAGYSFSSNFVVTDPAGNPLPHTSELISSEYEKPGGTFALTFTPGLFFKYVALDCGLGPVWTKTKRTEVYNEVYQQTSPGSAVSTTTTVERKRTVYEEVEDRYFVMKPGLTVLLPLEDYSIFVGARYKICPALKEVNGMEFSLGLAVSLE